MKTKKIQIHLVDFLSIVFKLSIRGLTKTNIKRIGLPLIFAAVMLFSNSISAQIIKLASSSSFSKTLEKEMKQLGEPYLSWLNNNSDKVPKDFAAQIANLKWPLEDVSETGKQQITKEEYYKSVFHSIRKLKAKDIDPIWAVIANNPVDSMCGGDFTDSTFNLNEWSGGYGFITLPNDPSLGTYSAGFQPPAVGLNNPVASCTDHHSMVSYGNDPILGSLIMTTPSSTIPYSFRLGNSCTGQGSEYLSKKIVVSGSGIIKFSYALVLQGPHGVTDDPSFWVKVYDNLGNPISNVVYLEPTSSNSLDHVVADRSNPFFQSSVPDPLDTIYFKDWTCAKIDLSKYIGQTISVALITADCSYGGHYGYGYIDNWCGNCEGTSTGTISIAADTCITKTAQVTATYTLPTIGSTTGSATITLLYYHNGIATGYTQTSPVLTINGTYIFTVDPDSLPCNGTGYDVVARADFSILSSNYSLFFPDPMTTDGIKPGQNNDMHCCVTIGIICNLTDVVFTQNDTACCYSVMISNKYSSHYFTGISITASNLTIAGVSSNNTWSTITYQTPSQVVFNATPSYSDNGIPLDNVMGYQTLGSICFAGTGTGNIIVNFIGPASQYDTICPKPITIDCGVTVVDTSCAAFYLQTSCDTGAVKMKFQIRNNSNFTMRGITLYSQNPNVVPSSQFVPIPDLLPGQTSAYFTTTLIVSNNADSACFFFAACDQHTQPGDNGPFPQHCCMDSIRYCVNIPHCDPCDGITVTTAKNDPSKCCYDLTLTSNYHNGNIKYIDFWGVGGTQFALLSGWSIIAPVGSGHIKIKAPGGGITPGTYPDFASFCLTGTSSPPYRVLIKILDTNGVLLCTDTLKFDNCQLVTPTCANITNDSLYCSGNQIKYTFYIKNNAPFPLYQVDFRTPNTSIVLDINHLQLTPPIMQGNTGGPYTVAIDSMAKNLDKFCMYLTGHNGIYDPAHGLAATECCTDSMGVICLPMVKCGNCDTCVTCDTNGCCQFKNMTIPNGITPNGDGKNDVFEILNSSCCAYISIKVFNRWGNMVYHNNNYKNDWKGVNDSGSKLVQGTYFIILELPSGNKKETYIDIRY